MSKEQGICGAKVLELGSREAVAIAGSLLQAQGAVINRIHCQEDAPKQQLGIWLAQADTHTELSANRPERRKMLEELWVDADIILISSDIDKLDLDLPPLRPGQILCDVTATIAGRALREDWQIQAQAAFIHITGWPDSAPQPIALPICNVIGAFYACIAILSQLQCGQEQCVPVPVKLDISLLEAAFVSLNVYLAGVLNGGGADPARQGNRHPAVAPWNSYPCRDGAVLICAGNQSQWRALCELINQPKLIECYPDQDARLAGVHEIDARIAFWCAGQSSRDCEAALLDAGIAAGRILAASPVPDCDNLRFRGIIQGDPPHIRAHLPIALRPLPDYRAHIKTVSVARTAPLTGLKVVELGQFTTAPLCSRILGSLGAEVVKIEKPGGDEQRGWQGGRDAISETFWLNNTGKQSRCIDLGTAQGKADFLLEIEKADILIDNLKSGTLQKMGLGPSMLAQTNPDLIHCAISGYGALSLFGGRPGFDMVIQGMSGLMATGAADNKPVKAGISAADLLGGLAGAVALLGAISNGRKGEIDLSMQDIAAWVAASGQGSAMGRAPLPMIIAASDGFVAARSASSPNHFCVSRAELCASFAAQGIVAEPVQRIPEVAFCADIKDTGLWGLIAHKDRHLPVLGLPFQINGQRPLDLRPAPSLQYEPCSS